MATRKRSLAKTVTWRIVAIVITFVVILIITANYVESLYMTAAIHILKTIAYYFHERFWAHSKWELKDPEEIGPFLKLKDESNYPE